MELTREKCFVSSVHNGKEKVTIKHRLSLAFHLRQIALADWMAHRVLVYDLESESLEARNVDRSHLFISVHRYRARKNTFEIFQITIPFVWQKVLT